MLAGATVAQTGVFTNGDSMVDFAKLRRTFSNLSLDKPYSENQATTQKLADQLRKESRKLTAAAKALRPTTRTAATTAPPAQGKSKIDPQTRVDLTYF